MAFNLPPVIALAFAVLALLPALLILLAPLWPKPGRRFVRCALLAASLWLILLFLLPEVAVLDLLAGLLLLAGGLLAAFTIWTIICWGFTFTLLIILFRSNSSLPLVDWVGLYTQGAGADRFTQDRLGVLLRLSLAKLENGQLQVTAWPGRPIVALLRTFSRLFGIRL